MLSPEMFTLYQMVGTGAHTQLSHPLPAYWKCIFHSQPPEEEIEVWQPHYTHFCYEFMQPACF